MYYVKDNVPYYSNRNYSPSLPPWYLFIYFFIFLNFSFLNPYG